MLHARCYRRCRYYATLFTPVHAVAIFARYADCCHAVDCRAFYAGVYAVDDAICYADVLLVAATPHAATLIYAIRYYDAAA